MTLATLRDVLPPAVSGGYAVPGLVCQGWEDMRAYAEAAQAERAPVVLQAGPACRRHTPLPVLSGMLRHLAASVDVPIVAHLDHADSLDECRKALDCGFTSVMYDGSRLPLARNIAATAEVAEQAHAAGASCEGEIGFVGYSRGEASVATDPQEAGRFARQTGVDAMAVSVGNVHLQTTAGGNPLNMARIRAIEAATDVPLVIHGGSGLSAGDRRNLAATTRIAKFNIGTELRMVFGKALRAALAADPDRFDRIELLAEIEDPLMRAARAVIRELGASGRG